MFTVQLTLNLIGTYDCGCCGGSCQRVNLEYKARSIKQATKIATLIASEKYARHSLDNLVAGATLHTVHLEELVITNNDDWFD